MGCVRERGRGRDRFNIFFSEYSILSIQANTEKKKSISANNVLINVLISTRPSEGRVPLRKTCSHIGEFTIAKAH